MRAFFFLAKKGKTDEPSLLTNGASDSSDDMNASAVLRKIPLFLKTVSDSTSFNEAAKLLSAIRCVQIIFMKPNVIENQSGILLAGSASTERVI